MLTRTAMRSVVVEFMQGRFAGWSRGGTTISDPLREEIAQHAADTVEKAVMESFEDIQKLSQRGGVYIQRELVRAYADKFAELLQADIEAAAQRHLLATLGPRVKALEDANAAASNPALTPMKVWPA